METQWSQPFHWGLLMAGDAAGKWAEPALVGNDIVATSTSLAVPVLRAQDMDTPQDDGATPCAQVNVTVVVDGPPLSETEFRCQSTCDSPTWRCGGCCATSGWTRTSPIRNGDSKRTP